MTRVNLVEPSTLSTPHLTAEYREIPRIVNFVRKSLEKKNIFAILSEVPDYYCLGTGHVKFFTDKLGFIKKRHDLLKLEGSRRGYKYNSITIDLQGIPEKLCKDYEPTQEEILININRIKERTK